MYIQVQGQNSTSLCYIVIINEQKYSWIVMMDASAMFKLVQVGNGIKYVLDSDKTDWSYFSMFESASQFIYISNLI